VVNGSGQGYSYYGARGEILRPSKDGLMRKQIAGTLPSIRNESWGREDD